MAEGGRRCLVVVLPLLLVAMKVMDFDEPDGPASTRGRRVVRVVPTADDGKAASASLDALMQEYAGAKSGGGGDGTSGLPDKAQMQRDV